MRIVATRPVVFRAISSVLKRFVLHVPLSFTADACNDTLTAGLRDDQFSGSRSWSTANPHSDVRSGGGLQKERTS